MTRSETEKEALIDAALGHVPFDGMNDLALRAAARDLGVPPQMLRVWFPQGGASLAAAYHRRGDAALAAWLAGNPLQGRFRDRIAMAVWKRLELADPELVRAGAAVLALPQNAGLAARLVWETADVVWAGLGDRSDDVNWYSKRATLSGVIGATVLYWMGDESENHAATRDFLDRRIDNAMGIEKLKGTVRRIPGVSALASLATGWIHAPRKTDLPGKEAR